MIIIRDFHAQKLRFFVHTNTETACGDTSRGEKKYALLKNGPYLVRKKKTMDYLLEKGYESDLIANVMNTLSEK